MNPWGICRPVSIGRSWKTLVHHCLSNGEVDTTKRRKLFPTDDSAMKVVYLAIQAASKKWTMPIRNWKPAMNRFIIEFGDRLGEH